MLGVRTRTLGFGVVCEWLKGSCVSSGRNACINNTGCVSLVVIMSDTAEADSVASGAAGNVNVGTIMNADNIKW